MERSRAALPFAARRQTFHSGSIPAVTPSAFHFPARRTTNRSLLQKRSRYRAKQSHKTIGASALCRARESDVPLYVAGRRVKVVSPHGRTAPPLTRRPASGVLLLGITRREDSSQ